MASMNLGPSPDSALMTMIRSAFLTPTKPPRNHLTTNLSGQTALITGSNSGIGLASSRNLLSQGLSRLVMGVRNLSSGEAAAAQLREGFPRAEILVWHLDMLSYDSIREFVSKCEKDLDAVPLGNDNNNNKRVIDIAILNAGVANLEFKIHPTTKHEETFQTNYLSTALLAILLLPLLRSRSSPSSSAEEKEGTVTSPAHLTLVASGSGLTASFSESSSIPLFPALDTKPPSWNGMAAYERYSVSKLLVFMLVHKLSESVDAEKEGVIINCVEPGLTKDSGLMRHMPYGLMRLGFWFFKLVASKTPEQAAWTYLDASVVASRETHGGLLMNWGLHSFAPMMYTPEGKSTMEQLWMETMQELDFAGAKSILDDMRKPVSQ